ncbi:MAG: DMT family transporter [Candidatus Sericytochromatia bacterium]
MSVGVKYILLSTFYFSIMNVFVKKLSHLPSSEITLFRSLLPLIFSYVMIKRAKINPWGNNKKLLFLRGLFGTGGLILYFYTLHNMPLANAVTLQYLSPIFATLIAGFVFKEKVNTIQLFFFLISFSGILVIKGFDTNISYQLLLIGIFSALCSGIAYNIIRKLKDHDEAIVTLFYFTLVTVPLVLPYVIFHWVTPNLFDWIYILIIGITTQVAQIYMTKAYQADKISKVANLNYIGAIYAITFGYLFFDEKLTMQSFIGILLIIFGSILSTRYKEKI